MYERAFFDTLSVRAQYSPASQYFPLFFPARCAPWASASLPFSFKHLGLQACACKVLVTVGYLLIAPFSQCLFKGMRNWSSPVRCPAGSRVHFNETWHFSYETVFDKTTLVWHGCHLPSASQRDAFGLSGGCQAGPKQGTVPAPCVCSGNIVIWWLSFFSE